jgi:hypothetical protein
MLLICWWQVDRYYYQYLERLDETPNPLLDITNSEIRQKNKISST